jgi:hypothetical protein
MLGPGLGLGVDIMTEASLESEFTLNSIDSDDWIPDAITEDGRIIWVTVIVLLRGGMIDVVTEGQGTTLTLLEDTLLSKYTICQFAAARNHPAITRIVRIAMAA